MSRDACGWSVGFVVVVAWLLLRALIYWCFHKPFLWCAIFISPWTYFDWLL
jgi:hypothetical protein